MESNIKNGNNLRQGVELRNGKYYVTIYYKDKPKSYKSYATENEANIARDNLEKEKEIYLKQQLMKEKPIQINDNGDCYFIKKFKGDLKEILVDEELYYNIIAHSWSFKGNYLRGEIKTKKINLSKFILDDYSPDYKVKYKDNNIFNYKKENLIKY